jgi:predicted secreted protein
MTDVWTSRIVDGRSGRVVFLAHCLLNDNTRYLGGARYGGAVREIVEPCLARGIGIVQLPCPEQHAWGGVLKRRLLFFFGSAGTLRHRLLGALLPAMLWYTRRVYRRLARETAEQIRDYTDAGITVLGVVGVDASPSCGVCKRLRVDEALRGLARLARETATAEHVNAVVRAAVSPGTGLYVELLQKELERRGLHVPFVAHDLIAELDGQRTSVDVGGPFGTASR